jgi:hypothetical protein
MIDETDITMKWALGFQRAREQYENLIENVVYSEHSIQQLHKMLKRYPYGTVIDATTMCGGNRELIHLHFQFEWVGVQSSLNQKLRQALNRAIQDRGVPDDLTSALGSFCFYAAIERATIGREVATIDAISVYIKDNYTFNTNLGEASQYLGHWSRKGIIVVPATEGATLAGREWADFAVGLGNPSVKGNVYYPVRNKDFRSWQQKHGRGGDFFIYSDRRILSLLLRPIRVRL